jgi:hypothetical protein
MNNDLVDFTAAAFAMAAGCLCYAGEPMGLNWLFGLLFFLSPQ